LATLEDWEKIRVVTVGTNVYTSSSSSSQHFELGEPEISSAWSSPASVATTISASHKGKRGRDVSDFDKPDATSAIRSLSQRRLSKTAALKVSSKGYITSYM